MKNIMLLIVFISLSFGDTYYAKLEPKESYIIKSSVSGLIKYVNKDLEANRGDGSILIQIDDFESKSDLKNVQKSIKLFRESLKNQKNIELLQEKQYKRIKNLKSKSSNEKDLEFKSLLSIKNQTISISNSLNSLLLREKILKDILKKKNIKTSEKFYIYEIYVQKDDFVTPGMKLARLDNISSSKLSIFVSKQDKNTLHNKKIYINDKLVQIKSKKLWNIADSKNLSSYKLEIEVDMRDFSSLYKVEIR